jgi:hypothetical protein
MNLGLCEEALSIATLRLFHLCMPMIARFVVFHTEGHPMLWDALHFAGRKRTRRILQPGQLSAIGANFNGDADGALLSFAFS